ncbi:MAG TPA: hypothetical protein VK993_10620 [Chthoniobacterales bacterium]|nr:hypothetical protein [Chthoniobacterales bacterium]
MRIEVEASLTHSGQLSDTRRAVGCYHAERIISTFRSVTDHDRFANNVQRAVPAIEAAGGRFIVKNMLAKSMKAASMSSRL